MIQPVNALTPRASFRGSTGTYGKAAKRGISNPNVALVNAGGVAAAAGGLTATIARGYTTSWAHAAILGVCGAFLALFFMTPHIIDKANMNKLAKKTDAELVVKEDAQKMADVVKEHLKPARKLVQFRQS